MVDLNKINAYTANAQNSNMKFTVQSSSAGNEPIIQNDLSLEKLSKKLNITLDQLNNIIAKNPAFLQMNEIDQCNYISESLYNTPTIISNLYNSDERFNYRSFKGLSASDQVKVYKYVLAQNQNLDNWDNLSDEERIQLAQNIKTDVLNGCKSDDSIKNVLKSEILAVLAANEQQKSVAEISRYDIDDYTNVVSMLDNMEQGGKEILKNSILSYFVTHEDIVPDNYKENVENFKKGGDVDQDFEYQELSALVRIIMANDDSITSNEDLMLAELSKKDEKSLSNSEKDFLKKSAARKFSNEILSELEPVNSDELSEFKKSVYFGILQRNNERIKNNEELDLTHESPINDKKYATIQKQLYIHSEARVYSDYIAELTKTVGNNEIAAKKALNLVLEIQAENPSLAHHIMANIVEKYPELADEIVKIKDVRMAAMMTPQLNSLDGETTNTFSVTQESMIHDAKENNNEKLVKILEDIVGREYRIADDNHAYTMGKTFSASVSHNVQKINAERTFKYEDAGLQKLAAEDIYNNSDTDIKMHVGTNLDKMLKENQNELLEKYSQDKDIANAINENGTVSRFDVDNQIEAFEILKNRFTQDDYSPAESQAQLKILNDSVHPTSSGTTSVAASGETTSVSYQTNPIVSNPSYDNVNISSPAAKSVYEQLVSGEISIGQVSDSFNRLTSAEKQEVLKSLPKSELVKMPVSICGFCPEFIPQFVAAHRGLEVLSKVSSATNTVIACMKKKMVSDPEIRKQFMHIAATEPWILSKASQMAAGLDNEQPHKSLQLRG